ncbi:hypothetical protein BDV40DRAFT_297116 [Aspergillus tamarii]|uniref:Uncharacterized protein n=1 Tax=Aspergillus tamarii TaxID=41984 RepID=A0A5N6V467_ASPTM|nr:hypothetical protein BDV40DRAFT_297116 [Aspergillus tamarii]
MDNTNTNGTHDIIAVAGVSPRQNLRYPGSGNEGPCQETYIHGGAQQLERYLKETHPSKVRGPQREEASTSNDKVAYFVELLAVNPSSRTPSYRVKTISPSPNTSRLQLPTDWATIQDKLKVLIFEDSASDFRDDANVDSIVGSKPQLFIYKMTGGNGHLADVSQWKKVRTSHFKPGSDYAGRLIVIVDAEDLRAEGIELSRHLSWEKTVEDFFHAFSLEWAFCLPS